MNIQNFGCKLILNKEKMNIQVAPILFHHKVGLYSRKALSSLNNDCNQMSSKVVKELTNEFQPQSTTQAIITR
jgi:hypothetical protein